MIHVMSFSMETRNKWRWPERGRIHVECSEKNGRRNVSWEREELSTHIVRGSERDVT